MQEPELLAVALLAALGLTFLRPAEASRQLGLTEKGTMLLVSGLFFSNRMVCCWRAPAGDAAVNPAAIEPNWTLHIS